MVGCMLLEEAHVVAVLWFSVHALWDQVVCCQSTSVVLAMLSSGSVVSPPSSSDL